MPPIIILISIGTAVIKSTLSQNPIPICAFGRIPLPRLTNFLIIVTAIMEKFLTPLLFPFPCPITLLIIKIGLNSRTSLGGIIVMTCAKQSKIE